MDKEKMEKINDLNGNIILVIGKNGRVKNFMKIIN